MALNRHRARVALTPAVLVGVLIALLFLCGFAPANVWSDGEGEDVPRPYATSGWVTLGEPARVTFYGPHYVAGDVTASGIRYAPDADIVALGPARLAAVREHYRAAADAVGSPLWWQWMPGPHLRFNGVAGGFPRHPCFACEPEWWGYVVRVCDSATDHCETLRVADTGLPALDVDLPDATWLRFGYPAARGVFRGSLQVLEAE